MTTPTLPELPDLASLQQLARALWGNGSLRGAAVLVGAGFSVNAICSSPDTPRPPLWDHLLKDLKRQLYVNDESQAPSNALRIAEEYRTYLGQAALDDFIRARFPDRAWAPGPLHAELLALPWSDVLTTNWDTLLERAAEDTTDYVYQTVRTEADLPHARAPRIIKLHGSLADPGPLIFAEEDYRTYPTKHAAFVNLARQVFIENELCLLGFSGDDPNFLEWAGWVRDQLGGGARRIYLAGYLNLAPPKRKFLEAHNISPIDFTPLVQELPEVQRYGRAAQLFLAQLRNAKPRPVHEWKLVSVNERPWMKHGADAPQNAAKDDTFAAQLLHEALPQWKKERTEYPGWLVCPYELRRKVLPQHEARLLNSAVLQKTDARERVPLLSELLWRRTISFAPLDERLAECLTDALQRPGVVTDPAVRFAFAIGLIRYARACADDDALERWGALVDTEALPNDPARLAVQYQRCLRARDRLDLGGLVAAIAKLEASEPIWKMRKAGLHAEIGEFAVASRLIAEAAAELERRHRLQRDSLWVKSHLGWADWMRRASDVRSRMASGESTRPLSFADLQIDPGKEIDALAEEGDSIRTRREEWEAGIVPLFDAGRYRDTTKPGSIGTGIDTSAVLAYEFDQLVEVVGIPLRINRVSLGAVNARVIATLNYQRTSSWYLWLLRTLHDPFEDSFNRFLGRVAIAQLSEEASRELVCAIEANIDFWVQRLVRLDVSDRREDLSHAVDRLRLMVMALSHFTVRMSSSQAADLFKRALNLAQNPRLKYPWILEALGELVRRVAEAIPVADQGALALPAIDMRLPGEIGADPRLVPEPIQAIWRSTPARYAGEETWGFRIKQLLKAADQGQPDRKSAILRLAYLSIRNALSSAEKAAFGRALWSEIDQTLNGLPLDTGLGSFAYAQLPAPDTIDAISHVRARVFEIDVQSLLKMPQPLGTGALADNMEKLSGWIQAQRAGLELEPSLARRCFDLLTGWHIEEKGTPDFFMQTMILEATDRLRLLVGELLDEVVPVMENADRTPERARALQEFIPRTKAWRSLSALPEFIVRYPDISDVVSTAILRGLTKSDEAHVVGASRALMRWARLFTDEKVRHLPESSIGKLVAVIEMGISRGLAHLLRAARALVDEGLLDSNTMTRLMGALSDLANTTQYREIKIDSIEAVWVSLIRVECTRLAASLKERIADDGTLARWIASAARDPLPEVRFSLIQNEK
jgi:hypothetical protein